MHSEEIWKPVLNFEDSYEVSNLGRVRSKERMVVSRWKTLFKVNSKILAFRDNGLGYKSVTLFKNGKRYYFFVHIIVINAFEGKQNFEVNHKDRNPLNNRLENLEYVNRRENVTHYSTSNTGLVGAYKRKSGGYVSEICINGKRKYLGYFSSAFLAHEAYMQALAEHNLTNKYAEG